MKQFCFGLAYLLWGSMVVHASENHANVEALDAFSDDEPLGAHKERQLATSCNPSRTIVSENFENGSLAGWTNGHLAHSPRFSKFLGRYGADNSGPGKDPFKVYRNIPRDADHVVLEVDFYEIDNWNGNTQKDYACIVINDERTDLGRFDENVNKNGRSATRPRSGLSYRLVSRARPRQIGFSPSKDQIHRVFVTIPRGYYKNTGTF